MCKRSPFGLLGRAPGAFTLMASLVLTLLLGACEAAEGKPTATRAPQNQSAALVTATSQSQSQSLVLVTATPVEQKPVVGMATAVHATAPAVQPTAPAVQPTSAMALPTPDLQATVEAAVAATLAAAPADTAQPPAGVAQSFLETFDNNRNGWFETHDAPVREVWIEDGEYHYVVKEPWEGPGTITMAWEKPNEPLARVYSDVNLQVRVRAVGDGGGYAGLAVCIDDIHTSYYLFVVYPDGSWGLEKRLGVEWEVLSDEWSSAHVKRAPESNLLQVIRSGSEITFFSNGVQLGSVSDTSLADGYIGVVVGAYEVPANAHWAFDDFQVEPLE